MLIYLFDNVRKKESVQLHNEPAEELLKEIKNAKREWENALRRFNYVSDPEVVDYIVFYIIAAERRYMFLLSSYKNQYNNEEIREYTKKPEKEALSRMQLFQE